MVDPTDEDFLLRLLNSTPIVDGLALDELGDDDAARAWLRTHGGTGSPSEVRQVREVRTALQTVIRGERSPAGLAAYLDGVSFRPSVSADGVSWTLNARPGQVLSARVVLAWDSLRASSPGRLRPCANPECALFLIDRSKANTARWCSMAVCGNRMKARRHYQRVRQDGS
jgi:predicted RNA-binding Zn ribbon-like protein